MNKIIKISLVSAVGLLALGAIGAASGYTPNNLFSKGLAGQSATSSQVVIATVNGQAVRADELIPFLQNGVERAAALDRRITQVVLAQKAASSYPDDAQAALDNARTNILSQIYANKRQAVMQAEVTDKEIQAFYDKNVTDDMSKLVKVKVYVTSDAKDAQLFYQHATGPKDDAATKEALAKMQYMAKDGEHFVSVAEVPYNLGQVMKKMKAGDILQPVVIREGVLIAMLEDVKAQVKPSLAKLTNEIRNILINQKVEVEVQALRKAAKIELKS